MHVAENDEMQSFSAAEIIAYEICPQMYRFNELWTYQPALREAMGYGNGLHFCLRRAGDIIRIEGKSPVEAVETSVQGNFHMPFAGGSVLENFKRAAGKVLKEFALKHGEDLTRIEEMEYRVEFPVQKGKTKATIMGRVDVILKKNNEMEVRDYKTSDEARTFEQAAIQVKLYTAGLKRMGRPVTSGSVAYLEGAEIRPVEVKEEELQKSKDKAVNLIDGILNKDFRAKPGEFCGKCDYAGICRWKN
jgi:DNA helicase-2/ATP-dependent DNA helicase PcrA